MSSIKKSQQCSLSADPALMGTRNLEILPVLCDGAPGDADALTLQNDSQLVIRQRFLRIFVLDQLLDLPLEQQ